MAENRLVSLEREVLDLRARLERLERADRPVQLHPGTEQARQVPSRGQHSPASLDSILTARTLAWTGGVVLFLGLTLFFAIAIDRGWIDETARVVLGAAFSLGLLVASAALRQRYGRTQASEVAAGAAIGGLFLADLAGANLYDIFPGAMGITIALAIAAFAVWLGLSWRTEPIAALGLAAVIVVAPVIYEDISLFTLAVIAIALGSAQALMLAIGWRHTVAVAAFAAVPQAVAWLALNADQPAEGIGVALIFWLLLAVPGIVWSVRRAGGGLDGAAASLVGSGTLFAVSPLFILIHGSFTDSEGVALAGLGTTYVLGSIALRSYVTKAGRDLRTMHWAIGLVLMGGACSILFEHRELLLALSGGAVLLAAIANGTRNHRIELASLAYLAGAVAYAVAEAPLSLLFDSSARPEDGIVEIGIVALAAGALMLLLRGRAGRLIAGWTFGALAVYEGSLDIVALMSSPGSTDLASSGIFGSEPSSAFQRAQTVVSIFWGLVGIGALLEGVRRDAKSLRAAGGLLLALAVGKAFAYDLGFLTAFARALSFLGLGLVLLVAAFFYQRLAGHLRPQGR